ncbi:nickel pincer cofactor biosynthesis protein LarB [Clostridium sp. D2Q-11]|uniref:Nickel pincer cofactor biosynthesis protein LarB n=1 Tax=Anaeromonas frigoriresistens TaxID=2683708 RepID=A0A942UXB1_9FIRM|nr:nickel pincer cofactor biosynthesis protein LarB [Anaeromonas frigoriresistens]MBS4538066.1 nickel pincer cofactor biosynthesis protein LarB [Anaeromonas frigoriresistens]
MNKDQLKAFLQGVKDGEMSIDEGVDILKDFPFEDIEYAKIDNHRALRNGYPEVIYCEGKAKEHIRGIIKTMLKKDNNILATRADREVYESVKDLHDNIEYHEQARIIVIKKNEVKLTEGKVLVTTGGTSDIAVAEEAALTLEAFGNRVDRLYDVGVAGIHRLLSNRSKLDDCNVIIAVAGMEGALASVVGGLVDKPVIAVPTSIGYGANFGGLAALLAMLNSCASGIGVVNIDNGFGAGYLASTINRQIEMAGK